VINSAKATTTRVTPFYANREYQLVIHRKLRLTFTVSQSTLMQIDKLKSLHAQLQADIKFFNKRSVVYANKHKS
jgi:hypothetical protein